MNIINKALLKAVLLPKGFYKKLGCNTAHIQAILSAKLTMDDRTQSSLAQMRQRNNPNKAVKNTTIWGMLGSLFMGAFLLFLVVTAATPTSALFLFLSGFVVLVALMLISDFTTVLLDVRDNAIILPKPINDRSFVVAKLLHIIVHVFKLVFPMALPISIYIGVNYGIAALVCFFPVWVLTTVFTIFLINAVYLLILKITTPSKFKNIISYIQIGFAILLYASSQLAPQLFKGHKTLINVEQYPLANLFPTYWFAKAWQSMYTFSFSGLSVIYLLVTLLLPVICLYVVVKYFAPSFNQKLAQFSNSSNNDVNPTKSSSVSKAAVKTPVKSSYSGWWANILTRNATQKMGFLFSWYMMLRSRDFKIKTYPSIGYLIVIIVMIILRREEKFDVGKLQHEMSNFTNAGKIFFIVSIYFTSMLLITVFSNMVISEKHKAAWLFFIAPIKQPGQIIAGAFKAAMVMFFVPMVVICLVGGIGLMGVSAIPNILLAISNQILISLLLSSTVNKVLPFSTATEHYSKASVFKNLAMMLVASIIGVIHFFIFPYWYIVVTLFVGSVIANYFLFKNLQQRSWLSIISHYKNI